MKRILNLLFLLMVVGFAHAAEPVKGIIVTYQGAETSYKFEEMPTVKYKKNSRQYAELYVKGSSSPVVSFLLTSKKLIVTYGEYTSPTSIDGVTADKAVITERNGKKYVQGGKLIIVSKDGRKYDINGTEIK